ncbi:hypothetical protein M0R45_019759 [Rubus argutus]|uniref:Uncharacterized protein n=1 Tax=Rubus argutus TaxID=59490 RepID=A0AAW1X7Q5_RUBAR
MVAWVAADLVSTVVAKRGYGFDTAGLRRDRAGAASLASELHGGWVVTRRRFGEDGGLVRVCGAVLTAERGGAGNWWLGTGADGWDTGCLWAWSWFVGFGVDLGRGHGYSVLVLRQSEMSSVGFMVERGGNGVVMDVGGFGEKGCNATD